MAEISLVGLFAGEGFTWIQKFGFFCKLKISQLWNFIFFTFIFLQESLKNRQKIVRSKKYSKFDDFITAD